MSGASIESEGAVPHPPYGSGVHTFYVLAECD